MGLVGFAQAFVVHSKRVGILHDKFAPTQQTGAGSRLVTVLILDLVNIQRQILVGGIQVFHQQGKHFLVGGRQQHIGAFAVLQAEEIITVFFPPVGCLIGFSRQQRREENFLGSNRVHFLTHHILDLAQDPQPQRQPRVHARGGTANITCAHQQLVTGHLSVYRVFAQSSHEEVGQSKYHGKPPAIG